MRVFSHGTLSAIVSYIVIFFLLYLNFLWIHPLLKILPVLSLLPNILVAFLSCILSIFASMAGFLAGVFSLSLIRVFVFERQRTKA